MTPSLSGDILDERSNTHGDFRDVAIVYSELQDAIYGIAILERKYVAAIDMICMKLARIACGDPSHEDHWIDIGGYAELGRRAARDV